MGTHKIFLFIHIVFGGMALATGLVAILSKKGNRIHRGGGKIFVGSMILTSVSAVILSFINPNPFLMAIGFFSLYLTLAGWIWALRLKEEIRMVWNKRVSVLGVLISIFMLYQAFANGKLNLVLLVFGIIQLVLAASGLFQKADRKKNIPRHVARIGGAYIATVTAFLVVNVDFLPGLILWLAPTVLGTILISVAITKWIKRTNPTN